LSTLSKDAF